MSVASEPSGASKFGRQPVHTARAGMIPTQVEDYEASLWGVLGAGEAS